MQASEDVGETSATNVDRIEVDLEKTILMIKEHENVVHALVLEQENANEDVELHAHIDGVDILNFTYYNLLPHPSSHPSSQVERMVGVQFFLVKFVIAIPSLIVVLKPFCPPSFSM